MSHPDTWHILPGESNWCEGDPCAIYLEKGGDSKCVLFVVPILMNITTPIITECEREQSIYDILISIFEDVWCDNIICGAFNYYLVHELIHWGMSE